MPVTVEYIVTITELSAGGIENCIVTELIVVAFQLANIDSYGLFASIIITTIFLVPKLCEMVYSVEVPSPIVIELDTPVAPVGPVGPVAPVAPAAPVDPVSPCGPVGPVGPVAPVAPAAPADPVSP
jgi:hypothetical protein